MNTKQDSRPLKTNREFSRSDSDFIAACTKANVAPTKRQASKFRRQQGAAYRMLTRR